MRGIGNDLILLGYLFCKKMLHTKIVPKLI